MLFVSELRVTGEKVVCTGLRRELPVRAVEKAPVGENLSAREADTQEEQGDFEWGPILTSLIGVPPSGQARTDG